MFNKINKLLLNSYFLIFSYYGSFYVLFKLNLITSIVKFLLSFSILLIIILLLISISAYKEFISNLLSISDKENLYLQSYEKIYYNHLNESNRKGEIYQYMAILYCIILSFFLFNRNDNNYIYDKSIYLYLPIVYVVWIYILWVKFYNYFYFSIVYSYVNKRIDRIEDNTLGRLITYEDKLYNPKKELELGIPPIKSIYSLYLRGTYEFKNEENHSIYYLIGVSIFVICLVIF
jgi:hypothetical protein